MPNFTSWIVCSFTRPKLAGRPPAPPITPLIGIVLEPKSMKSYSSLADQLFQNAHSAPNPTVQPTDVLSPVPLNRTPGAPGPKVFQTLVYLVCANATPALL